MSNNPLNTYDTISDNQNGGNGLLINGNALSSVLSSVSSYIPTGIYVPSFLSATSSYIPSEQFSYTPLGQVSYDIKQPIYSITPRNRSYVPISMESLNHRNIDNISLITNTNNNSFTGAGVLLFERNDDLDKNCVILFESNGSYQDLGGSITPNDYRYSLPVSTAAKREAFEETASYLEIRMNLNRVVNNTNIFAEIPANNPNYRCYAIGLETNAFNFGQYLGNLQKLNLDPLLPPQFRETTQARRFYLKDIQDSINSSSYQCIDINGENHYIRERTMICLRELMKGGKHSVAKITINYPSRSQQYMTASGISKLLVHD